MTEREEAELKMLRFAYEVRGKIMQTTIEIEKMIEYYIASRFLTNEDKIVELIITIISPLNLSNKIEIFILLVEKYDNLFIQQNPDIPNFLTKMREERNKFAHWPMDFSDIALNDFIQKTGITLVKMKAIKAKNLKPGDDHLSVDRSLYTIDGFNSILLMVKAIDYALKDLLNWQTPSPK